MRPKIASLSKYRKFAKLRGLRCFNIIDKMIRDGYALTQVAEFIQVESGEYTDVQRDSLSELLRNYRSSLPPAEIVSIHQSRNFLDAARNLKDGVKVLDELEYLYRLQKLRIEHFVGKEEETGVMTKAMSREMDSARMLVDKIHTVRLDLGMDERHLGTLTIQAEAIAAAEERYGGRVAEVLRNPEKRRRVLTVLEAVTSKRQLQSGEEVIQAEVVSDAGA
jgi:hypothetical protein